MTISQKLFLMATLTLGNNLQAGSHTHIHQALPYDAMSPKTVIILNFAHEIYSPFSYMPNHKKLAKWLIKGIANYSFDNVTIIRIANIIESNATTEEKVAHLFAIKADVNIKIAQYHKNNALVTGGFFVCFAAVFCYILYDVINSVVSKHDRMILKKFDQTNNNQKNNPTNIPNTPTSRTK